MLGPCAVVMLWLQAAGAHPSPASELTAAAGALQAEKYQEAATLLEKALASDPQDYHARFNLAFAYSQLNRDKEAIQHYSKVVEQQPELAAARLNLGLLLLREKNSAAAAPHLEVAAEKKPGDFRARYYLAEALFANSSLGAAEAAYRKALELDPGSAAAALGLGRTLARAGRMDSAREQLFRAARGDPKFQDALLELGELLEQQKQPAQALEAYFEYLQARPDAIAVRERAGVILLEQKRYGEAIEQLAQVVQQHPTAANQAALAQGYTMVRQPDKALPLLRGATSAEPANPDLRFRLATALLEARDFASAGREFRVVVNHNPRAAEAWNGLAVALYRTEDYPGTLQALDRARQLGPEPPGNHYLRAIILDRFHQYPAALESYEKFLAAAGGRYPDDEFKARQRVRIITNLLQKRR